MSAIILPDRWRQQPAYPLDLNWKHPLAGSLVSAWYGNGKFVSRSGLSIQRAGSDGVTNHGSAMGGWGTAVTQITLPTGTFGTAQPGTRLALLRVASGTNQSISGSGSASATFAFRTNNGTDVQIVSRGSSVRLTAAGIVSAGENCLLAARVIDTNSGDIWKNGVQRASSSGGMPTGVAGAPQIGADGASSNRGNHYIALHLAWDRGVSDAEMVALAENPWQVFQPQRSILYFDLGAGGGSSVSLVIADASHGHTADSLALSTDWLLTVADATHAHGADNVTLGVAGVADLVVADAAHAHSAEAPTLSTEWLLSIADALHGHAADNLTLSTGSVVDLTIADGLHSHTAEAVVLSSDSYLVVADSTHGHVADSPAFSLDTYLVIADGGHAHYADVLTLNTSSFSQDDLDFLLAYIQENLVVPTAAEIAAAVLAAAALDPIAANVKEVNDIAVAGTGVPPTYDVTMPAVIDPGDPWRPA